MELMLKSEDYSWEKLTRGQFDKLQKTLRPAVVPLEQSPVWGKFNDKVKDRSFLGSFSYSDASGKLMAIASATLYHERGRNWIWIKHGPLFTESPNKNIVQNLCSALKKQFRDQNVLFIRLSSPLKVNQLHLPFEHTMYDETVVVELEQTEDEILSDMSQSGRQGIRRSTKAGIKVIEVTQERVQMFAEKCYPILKETGRRDGFGIHPLKLYTSMLKELPEISRLYVASCEGVVEAWAITTEYSGQAMYYYGGSSAKARNTYAAYALHWEIIKVMRARGNKTYDFMGIAGKNYSGLKNVTQFKIKFSKNIVTIPLTYDLPLRPVKYHAFSVAIRAKRRLKR